MPLFGPPDVAKLKAKGDVSGLIKALGYEKSEGVRTAAAEALGEIRDLRALIPLLAALEDKGDAARLRASPINLRARAVSQALISFGDSAVSPLVAALKDPNSQATRQVAAILGQIGDRRAVEPLIAALNDRDWHVRGAAIVALGLIGDTRALEPLVPFLLLDDLGLRWDAAEALGRLGDPRAVEPLITAIERFADQERVIFEALGRIGDERAIEALIAGLNDTRRAKYNRQEAARALAHFEDPVVVEALIAVLKDNENWVRIAAEISLGKLGDLRAVEPLIGILSSNRVGDDEHEVAAESLGRLGDTRAVEPLIAALGDQDWHTRQMAIQALGQIGDRRALEPLRAALVGTDRGADDRAAIAAAIAALAGVYEDCANQRRSTPTGGQ